MTRAEKAELLRWIVRDLGDDFPAIESKRPCSSLCSRDFLVRIELLMLDLGRGDG